MPIEISLSSGLTPENSLLIPDVEGILKIANGDLGIADKIKKNFMFGLAASSTLDEEAMAIFLKAGGFETTKELSSYKDKDTGRLAITTDDMSPDSSGEKLGIKALEKTVFQTIFETQKPYLEAMLLVSESMIDFEDIIARVSGTVSKDGLSLRPERNEESLYSKVNSVEEEITKMKNLSNKKGESKFSKLTTEQKKSGIDMNVLNSQNPSGNKIIISNQSGDSSYAWEILSTEYSTGIKIEGIKYDTVYKDILDNNLLLDSTPEPKPDKKYGENIPKEDEKPPVIVFAHYNQNGNVDDINHYKWASWLKREPQYSAYQEGVAGPQVTKWYGGWEQLNPGDESKYESYIKDYVKNRLKQKNNGRIPDQSTIDEVYEFIKKKLDTSDIIDKGNENSFMNLIRNTNPEEGLGLGNDSTVDVNKVTNGKRYMFLPKKVNYKGKEVFIDPEADYDLQIIKLVPTKEVWFDGSRDKYNQQLKRTSPIIGNYQDVNVEDALDKTDYETSYLRDGYVIRTSSSPKRVQTVDKYKRDFFDTNNTELHDYTPTYIIEGILRDKPRSNEPKDTSADSSDSKKYYKRAHFFTAISKFIDSIIDIAVDLLPQLTGVFKLFSKPHEFIFDLVLEKFGDNFELLSNEIIDKFSEANSINDKNDKVSFVQGDPTLKKFVFIDEETGNMRFLFDSVAMFDLMGFNFGIQLTNLIPKFILNKNGRDADDLSSAKKSINGNFNDDIVGDVRNSNTKSNNIDVPDFNSGSFRYENISTRYSTGKKIEGIDYDYIYITQDVEKLIKRGDELFKIAAMSDVNQDLDSAIGALQNYDAALEKDPNNEAIKDKIDELKSNFRVQLNMMFKFLMNLVSLPIKIAKNILDKVLGLFDSIGFKTVTSEIPEFLTFEWLLESLTPNAILDLLGIRFNPSLLVEWLSKAKSGDYSTEDKFDLDQVMAMPFVQQLPEVNIDELLEIVKKPLSVLTQIFKFIEEVVTSIIQFILDIINIDTVIKPPEFNISKFINGDISPSELQDLLNGEGEDILNNSARSGVDEDVGKPANNFLYDIKLPNGVLISGLNRVELDIYIDANSDLKYSFKQD